MATDKWNLFSLLVSKFVLLLKDVASNLLFVFGTPLLDTAWEVSWPTVEILTLSRLKKVIRCLSQNT